MQKLKDITLDKTELEINYEDWFSEDNSETIVILHGWGGSSQSWLEVGDYLFKSGFNVVIPDLPGFGKTKLKYTYNLDEYAVVVENFIKELKLKNIILWGHSNGGAISIKLSNRGNIKIKRLVLNNSAGIRKDLKRNFKRKIFNNLAKPFKKLKKYKIFNNLRTIFYKTIGGHDYLNAEKNLYLKQTYLNMINSDLKDDICKIKENTLIIWGEKDSYTPVADGRYMRRKIKNSKMIILDKQKHGIHIHDPKLLVNTFLKNI